MKSLLSQLVLPLPVFLFLMFLAFILYKRKKGNAFRVVTIFSILCFFLISTPFLPDFLVKHLEDQYVVFSTTQLKNVHDHFNILVLGANYANDDRLPANDKLSEIGLSRLIEGIRIKRELPMSKLVTSGSGVNGQISQAEILANTALLLGVDSTQLRMQKNPKNTWQEAVEYKNSNPDSIKLIIVTSAFHMPRAMYLFHKEGLSPIAAPTNHLIKEKLNQGFMSWIPSSNNILNMECAIHEYVGMLWAKLIVK